MLHYFCFFFSFFFVLFHFPTENSARFSSLETSAIELKLSHSEQNDFNSQLVTIFGPLNLLQNTAAMQLAHCCCVQLAHGLLGLVVLHATAVTTLVASNGQVSNADSFFRNSKM